MTAQQGKHYRFEKYEFYAERGMITLIDTEAAQDSTKSVDEYTWRITPGKFMMRAIAARMHMPDLWPDKTREVCKLLEDATVACKLAKKQGDPSDPSVLEHVIKHQRKRQIVLPGELPGMPQAPVKMKLKGNSIGSVLTEGVDVVPDFTI